MASIARARELNPMDSVTWALSAQVAFRGVTWRRRRSRPPRHRPRSSAVDRLHRLGQAYAAAGGPDLALEAIADGERLANGNSEVTSVRGYVLARMDGRGGARGRGALTHPSRPAMCRRMRRPGPRARDREATFAALEQASPPTTST